MMRTCGVYCGAVFMCILAAALYANLLLVADIPSSPSSIKSLAAINNLIDATKYELFSVSFADKSARFFSGGTDAASVPVTSYRTDDTIVEIVDKRLPIVLTGSSASSWNALKWDIWELAKKFPLLLGVVVQKDGDASPMLLQHDREPGGMITEAAAVQPAETVEELLLINFLLSFKSAPVRMFYSTDFRIFQRMVQGLDDAAWRDYAVVEYVAANINVPDVADGSDATAVNAHIPQKSLNASIPNVWLLHPGSVMQARYSPYHTFRIHIKGVARYHLIPPIDVERCAYLYPNTHVSHGQSQVDFSEPDLSLTPAFINISVHEVKVLKAGEVLYIPPFWMVRTETDVGVMGLDVLSPSQEQLLSLEASLQLVPLQQHAGSKEDRIIAAQVYLVHVLSRLPNDVVQTPRIFAEHVYRQRFSIIYPPDSLYMRRSAFNCIIGGSPEKHSELIQNLNKIGIYEAADRTAACVNDPSLDATTRKLWAADYIETVARWAMQNPEEIVFFLTQCLNFDSKIEIVEEVEGPSTLFFSGGKE